MFCSSTIWFEHIFFISKQFRTCANTFPNEFTVRSHEYCADIEFFTGCKKIKQRRISFVLDYLRMILGKISTAISIKHRILETFCIKKKSILTACMPLSQMVSFIERQRYICMNCLPRTVRSYGWVNVYCLMPLNIPFNERICKLCKLEIKDEIHFLLQCPILNSFRTEAMQQSVTLYWYG